MSTPRRKDGPKPSPGKAEPSPKRGDDLIAAEDLFGDLVDAPPAPTGPPTSPRKEPIRVKVRERPAPAGSPPPKDLPEDMAKLLDILSPSSEAASPPKKAAPAKVEPGPLLERLEPPEGARSAAGPELDVDALFKEAETPGAPDALRLVEPQGEEPAHLSRTGPKFQATTAPRPEDQGLDLAAVAEGAFAAGQAAAGAGRPGREATWRSDVYGPYRLLDRVAVGGMAEVFKAKRSGVEGFEKIVAVKRILPHLSENKEFVDMFVNEAKMVAGLTHPNIVQIHDLGKIEKSYYIAMEYIHGRDLRTILRRAKEKGLRMPLDLSLRIVSQVCAALEYAHRKKDDRGRPMEIVHRDVSPQNILISFDGNVKLADFGIAKAATKASSTDRGALRGKLLYMSPEQAWGKPIDRRSDLFSLGLVLYEMITDAKPFMSGGGSGTEMSILETVRQCRIAPPHSVNPRIPESLERIAMKALERDPDQRYQDAAEMGRALERFLREQQPLSATELARFMELLFDREEREEAVPEELTPSGRTPRRLPETDLEGPAAEASEPGEVSPDAITGESMSVDTLLKRFGIK